MESSELFEAGRGGRIVGNVLLILLAVGACIGAFVSYRYAETATDKLENKQAQYDAVLAEKQSLIDTITEQGQAITDLDIEKQEAQNKLTSLEDALK